MVERTNDSVLSTEIIVEFRLSVFCFKVFNLCWNVLVDNLVSVSVPAGFFFFLFFLPFLSSHIHSKTDNTDNLFHLDSTDVSA